MLGTLIEGLRVVTVLLQPYLPASTERLLAALAEPVLAPIEPLFPRIEAG